jgi:hypothetical protein
MLFLKSQGKGLFLRLYENKDIEGKVVKKDILVGEMLDSIEIIQSRVKEIVGQPMSNRSLKKLRKAMNMPDKESWKQ